MGPGLLPQILFGPFFLDVKTVVDLQIALLVVVNELNTSFNIYKLQKKKRKITRF